MERRTALKNMGMVFGYTITIPTLFSALQSCKEKVPRIEWSPKAFTKEQGKVIAMMSDLILPRTDTPSATDVNVHAFIDNLVHEGMPQEQKDLTIECMKAFFDKVLSDSGKENLADIEPQNLIASLQKYLAKRDKEVEKSHNEAINDYILSKASSGQGALDPEIQCYFFATGIRDIATWGYKNSEKIGEEVLAYLPIPGEYVPCGDLTELTGGKAWSLR